MTLPPLAIDALLALHIGAGAVCLVLAPLALASVKGGPAHRRWGKIYFWSMTLVTACALVLAVARPILFLALLAVLSFYLAYSGYRVLSLKALAAGGRASLADWLAAIVALGACASLAGLAVWAPAMVQNMGVVAVTLGLIGMAGAASDLYRFAVRPASPLFWVRAHLGKFLGSYIAALTAFSVTALPRFFPHAGSVLWLWPSALGLPAIYLLGAIYSRRFARAVSA